MGRSKCVTQIHLLGTNYFMALWCRVDYFIMCKTERLKINLLSLHSLRNINQCQRINLTFKKDIESISVNNWELEINLFTFFFFKYMTSCFLVINITWMERKLPSIMLDCKILSIHTKNNTSSLRLTERQH